MEVSVCVCAELTRNDCVNFTGGDISNCKILLRMLTYLLVLCAGSAGRKVDFVWLLIETLCGVFGAGEAR